MSTNNPPSLSSSNNANNNTPSETFILPPESELRLEVPHYTSTSTPSAMGMCTLRLLPNTGSAEVFGTELPPMKWTGFTGCKVAVFTWHGCTIELEGKYEHAYVSGGVGGGGGGGGDGNACNVSYVNTHAQLEVMRDDAIKASTTTTTDSTTTTTNDPVTPIKSKNKKGPRVLICGPSDSGKTSLALLLTSYAAKLKRTPLFVDLDVSSSLLSIPGTISSTPINSIDALDVQHGFDTANVTPLSYWYGSTDLHHNDDLYKALLTRMGMAVQERLEHDVDGNASGLIVNSMGAMVEGDGLELLMHAVDVLGINVVLVMGHDRLYSTLTTRFGKLYPADPNGGESGGGMGGGGPKIIKLPRSGGVVSRDAAFRRAVRSNSIKRYFHGEIVPFSSSPTTNDNMMDASNNSSSNAGGGNSTSSSSNPQSKGEPTFVHRFTPYLVEMSFDDIHLYKITQVSLSKGMLPVSGQQTSNTIQITKITNGIQTNMKHQVLAVCHPSAVQKFERANNNNTNSGNDDYNNNSANAGNNNKEEELYLSSVAGFVVVEKVDVDREMVAMLSPCSGELPSNTLLMGDITWME